MEGDQLPKLSNDLRTHRSAPSIIFFAAHRPIQQRLSLAALADLYALSEADVFVGSASSHYSAVAGMLRLLRARPSTSTSSSPSPSPPPIYADERPLALRGAYSVGLLHAANLRPDADAAGKADRWRVAARRLVESIPFARWPTAAREAGQSSTAACDAHVLHGYSWRHSPMPAPRVDLRALQCL